MILSVVATVYNQAPYVAQMIESVLMQDVDFEYEFIIADDASTDGSADIIQAYADDNERIVFFRNKQNLGAIKNYAQCLKRAKGEYIADIGGDDYWIDTEKLKVQVDYLEKNEDVGMVYTQYDTITTRTGKIRRGVAIESRLLSGFIFDEIITLEVDINVCTSCFRRALILNLIPKFEAAIFPFEDTPMWLTISRTHKIQCLPRSTLCYRINEESLSHSSIIEKQLSYIEAIEKIRRYFIPENFDEQKRLLFEDEINVRYFVACLKDKQQRKYYFKKLNKKGLIIRILNVFPYDFVVKLHQKYLQVTSKN